MEPVEVERDPSQSEGPGKSQFTAAIKYLIQIGMYKEHKKGYCSSWVVIISQVCEHCILKGKAICGRWFGEEMGEQKGRKKYGDRDV